MSQGFFDDIQAAAKDHAISLGRHEKWLLVWDYSGKCRAYSMTENNFHFSVPNLNDTFINVSKIVNLVE